MKRMTAFYYVYSTGTVGYLFTDIGTVTILESSNFFQTVISAYLSTLGIVLDSKVRTDVLIKKFTGPQCLPISYLSQDLDELPDLDDEDFTSNSAQAPARTEIVKKPANLPMVQVNRETL
jgi:hypothetical protein